MKTILIHLLLFCSLCSTALPLSQDSKISLLTCSPGTELYSLFGHSAIRIEDPVAGMDIVFNYGTFDFNTPHFYIKYAQGLLPYQLSVASYNNFINSYKIENRTVWSQTLQFDSLQKQTLFNLLAENYEPKNRTYLYNFLFDNCSTRIRDIIEKSANNQIVWKNRQADKNFWNLLDEYLGTMPWIQWGIHTILGQPGMQEANTRQYMFLPDYLMYAIDSATYNHKPLIDTTETVFQASMPEINNPWYLSPTFVLIVVVLIMISLILYIKSNKLLNGFAILLFLLSGLIGILLIFLGFFTEHPITAPNFNLIWANPLNLIVLFFIPMKKMPAFIRYYLSFYQIILLVGIPVWFFIIPAVPMASISIIIGLSFIVFNLRQRKIQ